MNTSSNASTERRNPMPKPFTTIVPPSFKAASETYQYAPAVRIGDQILISGIVGADAEGRLPPDFRSQAENWDRAQTQSQLRAFGESHQRCRSWCLLAKRCAKGVLFSVLFP